MLTFTDKRERYSFLCYSFMYIMYIQFSFPTENKIENLNDILPKSDYIFLVVFCNLLVYNDL